LSDNLCGALEKRETRPTERRGPPLAAIYTFSRALMGWR